MPVEEVGEAAGMVVSEASGHFQKRFCASQAAGQEAGGGGLSALEEFVLLSVLMPVSLGEDTYRVHISRS